MNNRGEVGLKEAFIFVAIMCLCILITMVMYNRNIKDLFEGNSISGSTYKDTEDKVAKAAREYTFNNLNNDLENGDKDTVTIETLQNEGILDTVTDPKDSSTTCSGYVNFTMRNDEITYDPYIKCGQNYHTKGYNANYDA